MEHSTTHFLAMFVVAQQINVENIMADVSL
jgi:hypothetical protein